LVYSPGKGSCVAAENSFTGTINVAAGADAPGNVETCESYTLPGISEGNQYFTASGAPGAELLAGLVMSDTQLIYVCAAGTETCSAAENSFTVNITGSSEIETTSVDLCIEDATFDLAELLLGTYNENGTWTDSQNTGALSNGFIDPSMLEVGTYTFDYVISEGCASTTSVEVSINDDCVVLACGIEDIKGSISKTVTPNGDNRNDRFEIGLDIDCGFTYNLKV